MPVVAQSQRAGVLHVVPPPPLAGADTGTYTPALRSTGGSNFTGNFTGQYARAGNIVTVAMYFDINSVSGVSGSVTASLPYESASGGANFFFLPLVYATLDPTNNADTGPPDRTDMYGVFGRISPGDDRAVLIQQKTVDTAGGGGAGFQTLLANSTVFTTATYLYITGSYVTNGVKLVA